jgi:hypothetical protein
MLPSLLFSFLPKIPVDRAAAVSMEDSEHRIFLAMDSFAIDERIRKVCSANNNGVFDGKIKLCT